MEMPYPRHFIERMRHDLPSHKSRSRSKCHRELPWEVRPNPCLEGAGTAPQGLLRADSTHMVEFMTGFGAHQARIICPIRIHTVEVKLCLYQHGEKEIWEEK